MTNGYMTDFEPKEDEDVSASEKASLVNRFFVESGRNYQAVLRQLGQVPYAVNPGEVGDG